MSHRSPCRLGRRRGSGGAHRSRSRSIISRAIRPPPTAHGGAHVVTSRVRGPIEIVLTSESRAATKTPRTDQGGHDDRRSERSERTSRRVRGPAGRRPASHARRARRTRRAQPLSPRRGPSSERRLPRGAPALTCARVSGHHHPRRRRRCGPRRRAGLGRCGRQFERRTAPPDGGFDREPRRRHLQDGAHPPLHRGIGAPTR